MRKNLFVVLLFLLFANKCISSQTVDAAKGAVWLWGSTLKNQPIESVVQTLKYNYVNEAYILVKGERGTLTDSLNLAQFIKFAHRENIKVHFWYIVARDGVFLSKNPEACVYHCPNPNLGFNTPYSDTLSEIHFPDINFLYPGYKEYMLKNITYLLKNFDCDGIHLDNIRYTDIFLSFDDLSLKKAESMGCDTKRLLKLCNEDYDYYVTDGGFIRLYSRGDKDITAWVKMRKDIIYDYIKATKDLIQQIKPGVTLSAAFLPEGAYDPDMADVYYGQSYSYQSPLLSMISPMIYFKDCNKPIRWLKSVTKKAIELVDPKCKIMSGIQTYNGVTANQIEEEIKYSLDAGAKGIIAFKFDSIESVHWEVIRKAYKEMELNK